MWQLWCMSGKWNDWSWVNSLPVFPLAQWPEMVSDGACSFNAEKCEVIPEGVFKDPRSDAIYYSNGSGNYCSYRNMDHLWCLTGKKGSDKWEWLEKRPSFAPVEFPRTNYDGACYSDKCDLISKGVFRDPNSAAIYYSNGQGHYCGYKNMDHLWCLTGKRGKKKWKWLNSTPYIAPKNYPAMIYDGACHSKRCG